MVTVQESAGGGRCAKRPATARSVWQHADGSRRTTDSVLGKGASRSAALAVCQGAGSASDHSRRALADVLHLEAVEPAEYRIHVLAYTGYFFGRMQMMVKAAFGSRRGVMCA